MGEVKEPSKLQVDGGCLRDESSSCWEAWHDSCHDLKMILNSQLLNVYQSFLPNFDSSSGLVGGFHTYDYPILGAQIASLIPYDSLRL